MVKLTRQARRRSTSSTGHDERAIEGEEAGEGGGLARAAEALRNENYQVEPLLLAAKGDVPEDADVVIVAGPTRPLLDDELAALDRYLARGGALFALVDPRARHGPRRRAARVGRRRRRRRDRGPRAGPVRPRVTPFAAEYAEHPITRELARRRRCSTTRAACGPPRGRRRRSRRSCSPARTRGPSATSTAAHARARPSSDGDGPARAPSRSRSRARSSSARARRRRRAEGEAPPSRSARGSSWSATRTSPRTS